VEDFPQMTSPDKRRPLPALAFLVILTALAAVVWWRVLERDKPKPHHPVAVSSKHHHVQPTQPVCPSTSSETPPSILPLPTKITVRVLNSTETGGLAARATNAIKADGFKTLKAENDSVAFGGDGKEIVGVGQIRYGAAQYGAATLLSYYFPHATLKLTTSSSATVLVSLGSTYQRPATKLAVRRALVRAHQRLRAVVPPADVPSVPPGC
jgi:hypothetical protein